MARFAPLLPVPQTAISGTSGGRTYSLRSMRYAAPDELQPTAAPGSPTFYDYQGAPTSRETWMRQRNRGLISRGPSPQSSARYAAGSNYVPPNVGYGAPGPTPDPGVARMDESRRRRAQKQADFAESAPAPASREGYARRRAYINEQRDIAGKSPLGYEANLSPEMPGRGRNAVGVTPQTYSSMYKAVQGEGLMSPTRKDAQGNPEIATPDEIGQIAWERLAPWVQPPAASAARPASPYDSPSPPGNLPSEAEAMAKESAAAKERKKTIPITEQHAKAMWDGIAGAGMGQEGYNPVPIFQKLMGEYGIDERSAGEMAKSFQARAANPTESMFSPQQLQQARTVPASGPMAVVPRDPQSGQAGIYETARGRVIVGPGGQQVGSPIGPALPQFTGPQPATYQQYQNNLQAMNPYATGNVVPGYNPVNQGGYQAPAGQPAMATSGGESQQDVIESAQAYGLIPNGDGTYSRSGSTVKYVRVAGGWAPAGGQIPGAGQP